MIPLSDELPTRIIPWTTIFLIVATVAVWILVQGAGLNETALATSTCNWGFIPGELTHMARLGSWVPLTNDLVCVVDNDAQNFLTPITSMFLHGSWSHLIGNMLFFWVFGNNVEESMGHGRFLIFYLLCGLIAAAVHMLIQPGSPVPTVGASGAISGIMGAYLVLHPNVRVRMLFFFFIFFKVIPIRAWIVLIWWFFWQIIEGLPQLNPMRPDVTGGTAVWAHVGGFLAGVVLIKVFERRMRMVGG